MLKTHTHTLLDTYGTCVWVQSLGSYFGNHAAVRNEFCVLQKGLGESVCIPIECVYTYSVCILLVCKYTYTLSHINIANTHTHKHTFARARSLSRTYTHTCTHTCTARGRQGSPPKRNKKKQKKNLLHGVNEGLPGAQVALQNSQQRPYFIV